jgi:hypothetical protein
MAEFIADIFLCPLEATRIKQVSMPCQRLNQYLALLRRYLLNSALKAS